MKLNFSDIAAFLALVGCFFIVWVLITWVIASFLVTNNGPVEWALGWERTLEHFKQLIGK